MKVEYRVRPITRYIVTRYMEDGRMAGCSGYGTFDDRHTAYEVAEAMCRAEHQRLGYPEGDERISYPDPKDKRPPFEQTIAEQQAKVAAQRAAEAAKG